MDHPTTRVTFRLAAAPERAAQMSELADAIWHTREKIAVACRILGMEGLVDEILGHVSVRIPNGLSHWDSPQGLDDAGTEEMLIRCRGPYEEGVAYTQPDAIQRVTFDGQGAEAGYQVPNEIHIHSEIYRARPDVHCVIHAHPPEALICGLAGLELKPTFGSFNIPAMRMALEGVPVFPHAYLISRRELALPLVQVMGDKDVCLMRGHGVTVTGRSVEETVIRALNFHALAKVTLMIANTGRDVPEISPEDVAELPDLGKTFNESWVWRFYARKLADREAAAK